MASISLAAPHDNGPILSDGSSKTLLPRVYPDIDEVVARWCGFAVAVVAAPVVNGAVFADAHGKAIPTVEGGHSFVEGVVE